MSSSDSLFQADNQDENPSYFTYEARLKAIRKPQRGSDRFLENHQVEVRLTYPLGDSADIIAFRTRTTQEGPSSFIQVCPYPSALLLLIPGNQAISSRYSRTWISAKKKRMRLSRKYQDRLSQQNFQTTKWKS